jgi:hypothetical protein
LQDRADNSSASRLSAGDDAVAPIPRRPLRAEVHQKQLSANRQAIILAMLEIGDSTGQHLKISIPRIAAWAKLGKKTVQREIWGDHRKHPNHPRPKRENGRDQECPFCPDSLVTSRVLQPVTSANWKKHRPAEYRLNLELLDDCPNVRRYLDQKKLNFSPDPQRPTVASPPSVRRSLAQRPTDAPPSVPRTHDSKAFDSKTLDTREKHHAFGALMAHWIEIKTELQNQLPHEDYQQFIRPMKLFRAFGDALGLTLPPNQRMIERAKNCQLLQTLVRARGYSGAIVGRYPTDDELIVLQERYPGIEESWGKTLKQRCEDAIERRRQEDARDSGYTRAEAQSQNGNPEK